MQENVLLNHLLQLRDHYQAQLEDHERQAVHAREQLSHINALLVDQYERVSQQAAQLQVTTEQPAPPALSTEQSSSAEPAAALLEELPILERQPQPEAQQPTVAGEEPEPPTLEPGPSAEAVRPRRAMPPLAVLTTPLLPKYQGFATKNEAISNLMASNPGVALPIDSILQELYGDLGDQARAEKPRLEQSLKKGVKRGDWAKVPGQSGHYTLSLELLEAAQPPEISELADAEVQELVAAIEDSFGVEAEQPTPEPEQPEPANEGGGPEAEDERVGLEPEVDGADPLMLPEYRRFPTRVKALQSLMTDNPGVVLSVDDILQELYGELNAADSQRRRSRLEKAMYKGTKQSYWDRVPEQPYSYTLNLELLNLSKPKQPDSQEVAAAASDRSKAASRTAKRPSSKGGKVEMRPEYQGTSQLAAIEQALGKYAGQAMNAAQVTQELYGELEGKELSKLRGRTGSKLWDGERQGRWQRVPGREGAYTLDLKLVQ